MESDLHVTMQATKNDALYCGACVIPATASSKIC